MPCCCNLVLTFWIVVAIVSSSITTLEVIWISCPPPPVAGAETVVCGATTGAGVVSGVGVNLLNGAVSIALNCANNAPWSISFLLEATCLSVKSIDLTNSSFLFCIAFSWFSTALCKFCSAISNLSLASVNLSESLANSNSASASSASAKARSNVTSLPLAFASLSKAICVCSSAFLIAASASLTFSCICNSFNSFAAWFLFFIADATLALASVIKSNSFFLSVSNCIFVKIKEFCSPKIGLNLLSISSPYFCVATLVIAIPCLCLTKDCVIFSCALL